MDDSRRLRVYTNAFEFATAIDDGVDKAFSFQQQSMCGNWLRGRGWRRRRLRRSTRMERGETFSGCRENGALAPGVARAHLCLTRVELACVTRNKVSRSILPRFFLLTIGQPFDIYFRWLSSPKVDGSVSGCWMKDFRCDETKKAYLFLC